MKQYLLIFLTFVSLYINAQTTLNKDYTSNTTIEITDPYYISLLPGFEFKATTSSSKFIASISGSSSSTINNPIVNPITPVFDDGENYIYTRTYLEPTTVSDNGKKQIQNITFLDGLGRKIQDVGIQASPTGKDVVKIYEYDELGRNAIDWLAVPLSSKSGGIHANVQGEIKNYYSSNFSDNTPYSKSLFDTSPIGKLRSSANVGDDWNESSGHMINYQYSTNDSEVTKFVTSTSWVNGATKSTLSVNGKHSSNTLIKNTVTDEDGNATIQYTDAVGNVILIRKQLNATSFLDTYYVYNVYNQLAFVIPPLAVQQIGLSKTVSPTILNTLCYQYRYDTKGRMVEKRTPDKGSETNRTLDDGWDYLLYDNQDKVVATQDPEKRKLNLWSFSKYDQFGRVIYTGIYTSNKTRLEEQKLYDAIPFNFEQYNSTGFTESSKTIQYTKNKYPTTFEQILTVSYFDQYPTNGPTIPSNIEGQTVLTSTNAKEINTKSLATASLVKVIDEDSWTSDYIYYNEKEKVIATSSINHLGGGTDSSQKLLFSGIIDYSITKHKRLSTSSEIKITERFIYDHQNRAIQQFHRINNNQENSLSKIQYDELGQIIKEEIGSDPLQTIDYQYNIRGWRTKVNDPNSLNKDLFAYELKYSRPENGTARYNGNITQFNWASSTDAIYKRYNYSYDVIDRLTAAIYSQPNSTNKATGYYNENYSYDFNGNLLTLKRYNKPITGTTPLLMDNLVYSLYDGNRLKKVADNQGDGTLGYPVGGNDLSYDLNGNLVKNLDKSISKIEYNILDLPNVIIIGDGNKSIGYRYNALGEKIEKQTLESTNFSSKVKKTDYLDGFQYVNGTLKHFATSNGYIKVENNTFDYIYNISDHLGNIRVSFYKNSKGTIEVVDQSDYYPFGLTFNQDSPIVNNYNYKYNGKELQDEFEIGLYDFGARNYDPSLGRWFNFDPLSEQMRRHSPYNYAFNNPIFFIDPDGQGPFGWIGFKNSNNTTNWIWDKEVDTRSKALTKYGNDIEFYEGGDREFTEVDSGKKFNLFNDGTWSFKNNDSEGNFGLIAGTSLFERLIYEFSKISVGTVSSTPAIVVGGSLTLTGDTPRKEPNVDYYYRAMSSSEYSLTSGYLFDLKKSGEGPHVRRDMDYLLKAKFINKKRSNYDYIVSYKVNRVSSTIFQSTPFTFNPLTQKYGKEIFNSARAVGMPYLKYEKGFSYGFPGNRATTLFNASLMEPPRIIYNINTGKYNVK
ncbi:RHS repeat domain-containing protein [Empedobacter brevis]